MDYCRSVLAVAGANFRRLKRDARVWFIFVFTALLIHYYLRPVINYGIDTGTKAPIYIMELLFCSATISVKAPKILFYIGMLCLLCDAPFFYPLKPYIIMRSKRTAWWRVHIYCRDGIVVCCFYINCVVTYDSPNWNNEGFIFRSID